MVNTTVIPQLTPRKYKGSFTYYVIKEGGGGL